MKKAFIFAAAALIGVAAVGTIAYVKRRNTMKKERFEVIDSNMYARDYKYKKMEFKYYILDSTLTNDNGNVILNPAKFLGPDFETDHKLAFDINATSDTIGSLYIRDHKWRRDVKVIPMHGSYIHNGNDIHDDLYKVRVKRISEDAMKKVKGGK